MQNLVTSKRRLVRSKKQITADTEMSFMDHLEALRWHLVRSVAVVVIGYYRYVCLHRLDLR